ncbi:MAG: hypothetical protein E7427_09875 [Ruminococcaceae bacterium]|nr:hypothetical protein [Oscillospiraceae bacterium]
MKKAMVYILALTLAFTALLAGCGETRGTGSDTAAPSATPQATVLPENMMPDPEDGEVNDRDGIITDDDNGTDTKSDTAAERTANGNANGSAAGIGNGIGKNSTTGTGMMSASKR